MTIDDDPKLAPCPICGGRASVMHMYDTYDRADFGWAAGCARFCLYDGIHGLDEKSPSAFFPRVCGCLSKRDAIDAWNEKVKRMMEAMRHE